MEKPGGMLRLGFLASHGGTNMQAIIDACREGRLQAEPRVAISNNSNSGALERARREGITACHLSSATHPDPAALDGAILGALRCHEVEVVCLAGYMRKLGPRTLAAYRNRVLNIHPALLPRFGGKGFYGERVHQAVLAAGETESGPTVHLVDGRYDHGPILAQTRVPVLPEDTVETLAARVLAQEHRIYADTLQRIATGDLDLDRYGR
ncbi:MAG: phosphoribosylglycinamide formyltransferase [Candidatus Latescibacterota bacterium]